MALLETLPVGPGTAQWPLWSTTARLVVTDPGVLPAARRIVEDRTREVEAACSRFRPDSELSRLPTDGRPVTVGPMLAELVEAALLAAARTGGDVDPTLGAALAAVGYDRDVADLADAPAGPPEAAGRADAIGSSGRPGPADPAGPAERWGSTGPTLRGSLAAPGPGWRRVRLRDGRLTVPAGLRLDLGATAKAWAADRCARDVATACGAGVLVALGGDIATAGPAPAQGWHVLVRDLPGDPEARVRLAAGGALATSSTASRTWRRGGRVAHHVLDPRTGLPADPVWRTVSVAAGTCVEANTLTTAAVVRGLDALPWLRALGVPARLVGATGKVLTLGGWPEVRS